MRQSRLTESTVRAHQSKSRSPIMVYVIYMFIGLNSLCMKNKLKPVTYWSTTLICHLMSAASHSLAPSQRLRHQQHRRKQPGLYAALHGLVAVASASQVQAG
jgi:hypothetical protein